MLAQWKSDGSITRKCLDRNEDMYDFLATGHVAILSAGRIELFLLGSSISSKHVSSVEERRVHNRKCLDRNEDMYDFFGLIAILSSGRI
jgi:hypothetical protein